MYKNRAVVCESLEEKNNKSIFVMVLSDQVYFYFTV